jgi:nucleotide-binding universal stress UspA family protein
MGLQVKRICVPTDFSEAADYAVHYAAALAKTFGADLHLLHIVEHSGQLARHPDFTRRGEESRVYLKQLESAVAQAESGGDVDVNTKPDMYAQLFESLHSGADQQINAVGEHWWQELTVHRDIRSGHPVKEINHYVEVREIDMLVIGSHGHSKLASMLLGSVTERVVMTCGCPVTVIRHPEHRYVVTE